MKTYEEMTRSVIEKAQHRKAVQRRRNTAIALTTASFCLVIVSAVMVGEFAEKNNYNSTQNNPMGITTNDPINSMVQTESPRFTLLCASKEGEDLKVMTERVRVPCRAQLRVRNVTGMTQDERKVILEEENAYVESFRGTNPDESGYGRYCCDNVIVTLLHEGKFSIVFDDIDTVACVQVTATNNGYIFYPRFQGREYREWDENGLTVAFDGDSVRKGFEMLGVDTFDMVWNIAAGVAVQLDENPDAELSQFSDRITIKIDYTDGREEICVVRMEIENDGNVYAVLEGTAINA